MFKSATACVQCESEKPDDGRLLKCLHVLCEGCLRDGVHPDTASVHCVLCGDDTELANSRVTSRQPLWQALPPSAGVLYSGANSVEETQDDEPVTCSIHDNQIMSLYCNSCSSPLCGLCATTHLVEKHDVTAISETLREQRKDIRDTVDKLTALPGLSDVGLLEQRLDDLSSAVEAVNKQAEKASQNVAAFYDELAKVLEKKKQQDIDTIDQHRWTNINVLESEQRRVHDKLLRMRTLKTITERFGESNASSADSSPMLTVMGSHVLSLHGSVIMAARDMKPEDLNTPVAHITGKLGVSIPEDAVETIQMCVESQAKVFTTKVNIHNVTVHQTWVDEPSRYPTFFFEFALEGFDGQPLPSKYVESNFHASLKDVFGFVEKLQLTPSKAGKVGVWESQELPLHYGLMYILCWSSPEGNMSRISHPRIKMPKFNNTHCSPSLRMSRNSCSVHATQSQPSTAFCDLSFNGGIHLSVWKFLLNWEDRLDLLVGVATLSEQRGQAGGSVQIWEHFHGVWLCNGSDQARHNDLFPSITLVKRKQKVQVYVTLDLVWKRLSVLAFYPGYPLGVVSLPTAWVDGSKEWHPFFCLSNAGESVELAGDE